MDMNKFNFIIRIHQPTVNSSNADMRSVTISNITLIRKDDKYRKPSIVKSNQKKFGYDIDIKGAFLKYGGSVRYPTITFKRKYIDIEVRNFPRYPAFTQDKYDARNIMNGYGYNVFNNGYPTYLTCREVQIIMI